MPLEQILKELLVQKQGLKLLSAFHQVNMNKPFLHIFGRGKIFPSRFQFLTFEIDYQANKKLLDDLVKKHREEWKEIYTGRLMEEGQEGIAIFDFFNVLQEWFYLDQIDLLERASDPEDFFQSVGSYKRLFALAEDYFLNEKKTSKLFFK